jgi:5-methyltetrahydropteroyltriglutamate--homocysteine methyltransferase
MKTSTDRVLTTHCGSLPRPEPLRQMQLRRTADEAVNEDVYDTAVRDATFEAVRRQVECGLDVVNDGEVPKIGGFNGYVRARLSGYEGGDTEPRPVPGMMSDFPDFATGQVSVPRPVGHAELRWKEFTVVERDCENLAAAAEDSGAAEAFITASSPGTIFNHNASRFYATRAAYLEALGDVMKREYDAIVGAGLLLQIDCPDLAASRDTFYADLSTEAFLKLAAENVEVLNHATRDIPPDRMRMHVCWGAGAGPHNRDIELREVLDVILAARPAGLVLAAANSRHDWEWEVWKDVRVPEGKVIIPGVIDSTTTTVEHPETVAQRIIRYAQVLGRERILAGVDCGMGYWTPERPAFGVAPTIVWAKCRALSEGAARASARLWSR